MKVRTYATESHPGVPDEYWIAATVEATATATVHGRTVVAGRHASADEVDPLTGVAMIAKDNAPVLLHCSAGVGRTGGFIAVDAVLDGVRREMRKRKEGIVRETAAAQAASDFC